MFENALIFTELLVEQRPEESALLEKVRAFRRVRKERTERACSREGKFLTLSHGDAWCNNFMFRFSTHN